MTLSVCGQDEATKRALQIAAECCNMAIEDLLDKVEAMKNQAIIQQHPYTISPGSDGRYRTYLSDASMPKGRRQIAKSTLEAVHTAIIADFKRREEEASLNLENVYEQWMLWRRGIGTDPKTLKENANDWKRFLADSNLVKMKVEKIKVFDLEDFFFSITKGHAITFKRLSNVRTVLEGIFKYAIRLELTERSIVFDVNYRQFRTRCKPSTSKKDPYTDDERKAISEYLEDKTDIYSLAISFAFQMCLRIGELQTIKKADFKGDTLFIGRSMRRRQQMNDDLTFGKIHYDIDPRVKGNAAEGIRNVYLTPKAQTIARETMALYPDGEYLFMRDGAPIIANTFNEHLERLCKRLGIPYRSCHQIRFTTATTLYKAGVDLSELSRQLGHTTLGQSLYYIRQGNMSENSKAIAAQALSV
jgi:integrase